MSNLFRKKAVENHLSNKERTLAVKAIPIKWALYTMALLVCAVLFAVWLFFGTIYETLSTRGTAWSSKSYGEVYAEESGIISKTTVSVGDTVEAGDILAFMPNENLLYYYELEDRLEEYDRQSVIRSKVNGIVTYIIDRNSYVASGDLIASVMRYDENGNHDIITAFVSDEKSSLLSLGMDVHVMPDYAPREQYGYITGYISAISKYPITGEQIYNSDKQLFLSSMDAMQNYVEVEITMMRTDGEGSRLKWSKSAGSEITVSPGTRCDIEIILNQRKPYEWLLRRGS